MSNMVPLFHHFINTTPLLLLFSLLLFRLVCTYAQATNYNNFCSKGGGNYTKDSMYERNLNLLLSNLSSEASLNSFYDSTAGENTEKVYGLFLCRGDVSLQVCHDCVSAATQMILQICPNNKAAIVWYAKCMIRYSDGYIFSIDDTSKLVSASSNGAYASSDQDQFNKLLSDTMKGLIKQAAYNSSTSMAKFSTGEANITISEKLYCLVQCIPDLTGSECDGCLQYAINFYPRCCAGTEKAKIFQSNCQLMYDVAPFYEVKTPLTMNSTPPTNATPPTNSTPPTNATPPTNSTPPMNATNKGGKGSSSLPVIVVPVVAVVAVLLLFGIWFCLCRVKSDSEVNSQQCPQFKLEVVSAATQHFSNENFLGKGGFGPVYKGKLVDGREIAVKCLSRNSQQGTVEFNNEVNFIANLQHRNLVKLLGCCVERNESMLIYEYMPNKSLDEFLFANSRGGVQLNWRQRLVIINGIARGLLYLHEDSRLRIIHRDLKPSNVLLDHEMNPKISDFGLAKLFDENQVEANTTKIAGSHGYMAPEYISKKRISLKSDVYSCGVLLLEIISGERNSRFSRPDYSLVTFAWKLWSEGQALDLIDPKLEESYVPAEVLKCIKIGLLCVQDDPAARPAMSSVVNMLSNDTTINFPQPTQPAYVEVLSNEATINEVTLSTLLPR